MRLRFAAPPAWQPEIKVERRFVEREPAHASVLVAARPARRDDGAADAAHRPPQRPSRARSAFPAAAPRRATPMPPRPRCAKRTRRSASRRSRSRSSAALPTYTTGTGFIVTPVVGLVQPGFALAARSVRGRRGVRGAARLADGPGESPAPCGRGRPARGASSSRSRGTGVDANGEPRRYFIWGATAAMLRNLYRFLAA